MNISPINFFDQRENLMTADSCLQLHEALLDQLFMYKLIVIAGTVFMIAIFVRKILKNKNGG